MIAIKKQGEPAGLTRLRERAVAAGLSPKEAYDTLRNPLKEQVRNSLLEEQGQLCAYCMCRIPRKDVDPGIPSIVMEHMIPRDPDDHRDIGQGLDYNNLVVVCHGNRGSNGTRHTFDLTCDAYKGNREFKKLNPCKPDTLQSIFYKLDGQIDASDPEVKSDLLDLLNLNCPSAPLVSERKSALDSLIQEIKEETGADEGAMLSYCIEALAAFHAEKCIKTPYVGILIWYLQTMIEALRQMDSGQ